MLDRITPFILTLDEAPNIRRTLDAVAWANEVVVVDSGSTDGTLEIAAGYPNVRTVHRSFDTHAAQFNFALEHARIETEWVLAMDADYVVSTALRDEIGALRPQASIGGYSIPVTYCVNGAPLRASLYPPVVALYRRSGARYVQDGHTQRVQIDGRVERLRSSLLHDDRKSVSRWLRSQRAYMTLEAEMLLSRSWASLRPSAKLRRTLLVAPIAVPLWCLFAKGLVLDGWPGIVYTLQRTAAEWMLSLELARRSVGLGRSG